MLFRFHGKRIDRFASILPFRCVFNCLHKNFRKRDVSCILGDSGAVSRVGRKGETKVFKYGQKSPWVPTLTELFPKIQADAGSWLGTKNSLYYCAQSANSFSWVPFVSSYTTATVSITPCLANAPEKCTQSGNFQFDIKSPSAGLSKRF